MKLSPKNNLNKIISLIHRYIYFMVSMTNWCCRKSAMVKHLTLKQEKIRVNIKKLTSQGLMDTFL